MDFKFDDDLMAFDDDKQQLFEEINHLIDHIKERLNRLNEVPCNDDIIKSLEWVSNSMKAIAYSLQHDEKVSMNDIIRSRKAMSCGWDVLSNSWLNKKGAAA